MAMQPIQLTTRIDSETGEVYVCAEQGDGVITWLFPLLQASQIMDYRGHRGLVSADGSVKVQEWGGNPLCGTSASGAAGYAYVLTPGPGRTHVAASCVTNGAVLSLDGGVSNALPVGPGATAMFHGIEIPADKGIYAKNAVGISNYASLWVAVW